MAQTASDTRRFSLDLALIAADLHRVDQQPDELLAIGQRLSLLAAEITTACELACIAVNSDAAA